MPQGADLHVQSSWRLNLRTTVVAVIATALLIGVPAVIIPIGKDENGKPVFAAKGHRIDFTVPVMT